MYACMYVCIYLFMHICIYVYNVYIFFNLYECIHCVYIYMYNVCLFACLFVCLFHLFLFILFIYIIWGIAHEVTGCCLHSPGPLCIRILRDRELELCNLPHPSAGPRVGGLSLLHLWHGLSCSVEVGFGWGMVGLTPIPASKGAETWTSCNAVIQQVSTRN